MGPPAVRELTPSDTFVASGIAGDISVDPMAEALFAGYQRHRASDEMFERSGEVRRHCG
jgi:hypothetical protein